MSDRSNQSTSQPITGGQNSIKLPTFLVIGAMRAGTTTLYYTLAEHHEVYLASIKETNFFTVQDGAVDLPLTSDSNVAMVSSSIVTPDEYRQLFKGASWAKAVGEVSPSYLYSRAAAARIKSFLPEVRLVALLRDPVDRAHSAYLRRADAVNDPEAFLKVAEEEQRRLDLGQRLALYPLVQGGLYAQHLRPYLDYFLRSRISISLYEEFWAAPDRSFRELHEFLGIEPLGPGSDVRFNRSGVPRYPHLDRLVRGRSRVKGYAKRNLPPKLVRSLVRAKQKAEDWNLMTPERLPSEVRARLIERYFASDIRQLEVILERGLEGWSRA